MTTDLQTKIRDCITSSKIPMTARDIVMAVYQDGIFTHNRERYVNTIISRLRLLGDVKSIDGAPRKYLPYEKQNPLMMDTCAICGSMKFQNELNEHSICSTCTDLSLDVNTPEYTPIQLKNGKVGKRLFGVHETPVQHNPLSSRKHVEIMRKFIGFPIKATVSTTGKVITGKVSDVDDDGYMVLSTQYGPALINTTKAISFEILEH